MWQTTRVLTVSILCIAAFSSSARAESQIKNVLFIISDDLKASVLGCYGDQFCHTPNIDKLASQSVVFERAYCQGVSCAPSRQSLMFSRYQGKGDVNLGEYLQTKGMYSARVGKIYHMRVPGDIIAGTDGLDVPSTWTEKFNSQGREAHTPGDYACLNLDIFTKSEENRQSTKMPHRMFVSVEYDGDGSDQPDHKSATKATELLATHKDDPFFLAVGLVRPHYPMVAPREFFSPYPWEEMTIPFMPENDLEDIPKPGIAKTNNVTNSIGKYPDNQKRMWTAYYGAVTFMDEQVGRIISKLDELGLRDSTAIVFTSDHGYHLGEHGFWQKSNLHEEVLRVPLMISAPGIEPSRTKSLAELVDIFPTLTDLLGHEVPDGLHGTSLLPVMKDPETTVKDSVLSFHNGHCLRTSEYSLIHYNDGSQELYDMTTDPNQFTNLATDAGLASVRNGLLKVLKKRLSDAGLKPIKK